MTSSKIFLLIIAGCVYIIPVTFASPPLQTNLDFDRLEESISSDQANFQIPTPRYRLSRNVIPKHYIIKQRPILLEGSGPERFTAPSEVTITILCNEDTNEIILHRYKDTIDIRIDDVKVTNKSNGAIQHIVNQTFEDDKDFYKIILENPLNSEETYDIFIPFNAIVKVSENLSELVGLYGSYYMDPTDNTNTRRYLSTTKFEPFHTRKAFPCFDEPDLKATFKIILGRHMDYHSLSNMKEKNTTEIEDLPDWFWDDYEPTVEMSTYLVCMIVSDFESVDAKNGDFNKPVSVWAPSYIINANGGDYAAKVVDKLLYYLENKVKIPYALPKMDSISIPQFPSGAMENWGLNTYRESLLIYYPNISTETDRGRIDSVLTHELAHQWFGNLVTCKWWSDIWLNEGFATYIEFLGVEQTAPDFETRTRFVTNVLQLAMRFDQGPLTHPVKNTALIPSEIVKVFSRISYEKGASLIRMMESFLTEDLLWKGLLAYLEKYGSKGAEQDNLFESLTEAGQTVLPDGFTVKDIMDPWTLKSGYPLVRVSAAGLKRLFISQEKFTLNEGEPQPNELWHIPLTVVTSDNPNFSNKSPNLWMNKNEILVNYPVSDTSKWLMFNSDGVGYYRVHYDEPLLNLIKEQLKNNHTVISPVSRSQLLDDYFNFAFLANYADVTTALELTEYLAKETELVVWNAVLTNLREPVNKLSGTPGSIAIEYYLKPRVEAALKTVQNANKGAQAILRATLMDWACSLGSEDCLETSEQLLKEWEDEPDNLRILTDIQSVVFCAGVSRKGAPELTFLYSKYNAVDTHEIIKLRILNALGCFEDTTVLSGLLKDATDPSSNIREIDRVPLLQRIVANINGRNLAYEYVTNNFVETGVSKFASVISSLSLYWHTTENLTKLETFINENKNQLTDVMDSLNLSLENIRNNMAWVENIGKPMATWMIGH